MNSIIKNILKALIYSIPAVSMVVADSMIFPFITGKSFLFRVVVELCLCLYIALATVDMTYRPKKNALFIAFAVFVGVIFIADMFALNPSRAFWSNFERMEGFVLVAHLFAYFVVLAMVIKEKKDWMMMLYSTVAISVFMTFFAFLQFFGGAVINQGSTRLDGTLGNSAYMAVYLLFHIFFILYLWVANGNKLKGIGDSVIYGSLIYIIYYLYKIGVNDDTFNYTFVGGVMLAIALLTALKIIWLRTVKYFAKYEHISAAGLYVFLILAECYILFHTETRGAMLGFIGGLLLTALIIIFTEKENKLIKKASIIILALLLVGVGVFYIERKSNFVQSNPVLNRFASISLNDTSQARAIIWPMAIEAFREHPYLGWGQDNFIYAFTKYYRPELIRHEPWFDRTHNAFLDWLLAGGILGFLAYLSLYFFAIRTIIKSKTFNSKEKAVLLGLFSAYAFQSIFIFDNLVSYMLFVLLLGFADFGGRVIVENKKERVEDIEFPLLASVFGIFLVMLLMINYKPYEQNVTLAKGLQSIRMVGVMQGLDTITKSIHYSPLGATEAVEQLLQTADMILSAKQVSDSDKNTFANKTFDELKSEVSRNPIDARAHISLGSFLFEVGMYDDSLVSYEKARELSPKKQPIYYLMGRTYLAKAEREKNPRFIEQGLEALKYAYDIAPEFDGPKSTYATGLIVAGHFKEALDIVRTMGDPRSFAVPQIIKVFSDNGYSKELEKILAK